jgi:large subunit ribosomal protein L25
MIELKVLKRDTKESTEYIRSQGRIPAVMYGANFESTPVSVDDIEFRKVYREAGTSNVINTSGDFAGEMILVQDMHVHVVSGEILNIDFKVISKGETTEVTVPVELIGEAPAVKNNIGALNFSHEEVVIETIPSKIPNNIEIDISKLENIGDSIKLSDLKLPEGVLLLDDADITVVSIIGFTEEKEEIEDVQTEPELVDQKGKEEVKEDE